MKPRKRLRITKGENMTFYVIGVLSGVWVGYCLGSMRTLDRWIKETEKEIELARRRAQ